MMLNDVRPKLMAYHDAWNAFDQFQVDEIVQVMQQSKADYASSQREFLLTLVLAGLLTGAIAIFTVTLMDREIAVRRGAEQSLQQVNAQLEHRVLDRTADLRRTNEDLQGEIIERKRAEESLKLLGSAVEQSKESILITDAELDKPGPRIIFVNRAFTKMTGYAAEEVIGKTPLDFPGASHG